MGIRHVRFVMKGHLIMLASKNNDSPNYYYSEIIQAYWLSNQVYSDCVRPPSTGRLIPLM